MSTDKELRELCETFADWWSTQHVPDIATPDYIAFKAYKAAHAEAKAEIEALKCRIDNLMWEYCPEEMTSEQIDEWGKRQRVVSQEETGAINAAMASEVSSNGQ